MFKGIRYRFHVFSDDTRGAVLIWLALLILPLTFVVAVAIDLGQVLIMKRQLASAADAAALNAGTNVTLSDVDAQALVNAVVQANYPAASTLGSVTSVTVQRPDANTVKVTASGTYTTSFLRLFGYDTLNVTVSSTAAQAIRYLDIYTAVDQSASLGIAADAFNRAKLQALTRDIFGPNDDGIKYGCEFACHQTENGWFQLPKNQTMYEFARSNNIVLREDILQSAFSNFVTTIFTSNPHNHIVRRVGVIGFSSERRGNGTTKNNVLDLTGGPTADEQAAASALAKYPNNLKLNTTYETILPQLNDMLGPQGTGYTQDSPVKIFVMITDGVRSDRGYSPVSPIDKPLDANWNQYALPSNEQCSAIKNKKIIFAVIDVKYVNSNPSYWFNWHLMRQARFNEPAVTGPVYDQISPALQECASPGWYFQATDTNEIDNALARLLDQINKTSLRLVK
jgi:Flp pilus assembly protein TadG